MLYILYRCPFSLNQLPHFGFSATVDLDDASTIKQNDIIPGGTLTLRIWSEDAWGRLVIAAAKGKIGKVGLIVPLLAWRLCLSTLQNLSNLVPVTALGFRHWFV